jgi:hypothetical protein
VVIEQMESLLPGLGVLVDALGVIILEAFFKFAVMCGTLEEENE